MLFGDRNVIDASSSDMIDEEDRNIVDDTKESYSTRSAENIRNTDSQAYRKNSTAGHMCEDSHSHETVERKVNSADLRREQMYRKADEKASKGVDFSTAEKKPQNSGGCSGWIVGLLLMFIGFGNSALLVALGALIFTIKSGREGKKNPAPNGKNGLVLFGVIVLIVSVAVAVVNGDIDRAIQFFQNIAKIIDIEVFGNSIG